MRDKLRRLHERMNVDKESLGSICSRTRSYEQYLEEVYVFSTDRISNEKRFEIEAEALFNKMLDAWQKQDVNAMKICFHPNCRCVTSMMDFEAPNIVSKNMGGWEGIEEFEQWNESFTKDFTSKKSEFELLSIMADEVLFRGLLEGELGGQILRVSKRAQEYGGQAKSFGFCLYYQSRTQRVGMYKEI